MENFSFFSKNLKTYLFAMELTKEELSTKLGIGAPSTVGKWISENRPPKGSSMKMLTQLIGFNEHDLVNKDLTIDIIQATQYGDLVIAEGVSDYVTRSGNLKLCIEYIELMQIKLTQMLNDGKKVLDVTK